MSLEVKSVESKFKNYIRKIRCPRNYILKPGGWPFVMEINPMFKFLKDADAKIFGIKKYRRKKDRFGNFIQNFKDYYQPEISAELARTQIYEKDNQICNKCRRCVTR